MDIFNQTTQRIKDLFIRGTPVVVAWSGGKDSSAVLGCTLNAALSARADGFELPPIIVTNSDTGIENPEIHHYIQTEIGKIEAYAAANDLPVLVHVAYPAILDRWIVKTVGKRSLPTFADSKRRECSNDMKVLPQKRLRKKIFAEIGGQKPITLIGTRFDESAIRGKKMSDRGDSDVDVRDDNGELYLAPIAQWFHDDVWCFLSECSTDRISSYSDFKETARIYTDASGEG